MATHTEPGRGRKKCNACGIYVGVRSARCEKCQNPFPTKDTKPIQDSKAGDVTEPKSEQNPDETVQ